MHRKVVIDTNCLIQILGARSKFHVLWESFINNKYDLCISNEILHEYEEILSEKVSPRIAYLITQVIARSSNVIQKDPYFHFYMIRSDIDDNKFTDCAIICNADYIVTNDHHFDEIKQIHYPQVNIMNIEMFYLDIVGK